MSDRTRLVLAGIIGALVFLAAPWVLAIAAVACGVSVGEGQPS